MWIKDTLSWMKPSLEKKVAYFFFQDDVLYNKTSPGPSFDVRDENRLT